MPGEVTRITVPSQFEHSGDLRKETAVFKLGLGSCGKVVDKLAIEFGRSFIHIFQRTTDGATKRFSYAVKDLTGRIITEY